MRPAIEITVRVWPNFGQATETGFARIYAIMRRGEKALCSAALITGDWLIASEHCVRKHKGKQLTADIGSKRVDIKFIRSKKNRDLALLRLGPELLNPNTMKLPIAATTAL